MKSNLEALHPELRGRLEKVAKQVRRRQWFGRLKQIGWCVFALTCVFTVLLAVLSPDGQTGTVLFATYVSSLVLAAAYILYRWLRQPITLEQVALYIDEHHPELENRIASALNLATDRPAGTSEWLVERFVEDTVPIVLGTSFSDVLSRRVATSMGIAALSILLSSGIIVFLFRGLWLPSIQFMLPTQVAKVVALPFTVEPGDVRVRRGDNQMVWIRTKEIDRALQMRWRVPGGVWQDSEVSRTDSENVLYYQFMNVQTNVEYQVHYGRRRSPSYTVTVWTPPEVEGIDLTYTYPDYLQRDPREVPNSGNITAIEGTVVDVEVWVNKALKQAELVLDSGERLALDQRADKLWSAPITIARDDTYHIELFDLQDEESEYNPNYDITMARDKAPEISIDFPRGDNEVTLLEEVPFDFEVSDDFGFDEFGLQYEIAGREPIRIALNEGNGLMMEAEGHHQMMLEDMGLEVGDFITWTIWATDTKPDRSEFELMGDPYFLEIRPFKRQYREAVSGGGGGGGGGMEDGDAEQAQKDVLIATWNLRRESKYMDDEEFTEKRDIIVESQSELLDKVAEAGGMTQSPNRDLLKLRESMRGSTEALTRAELPEPKPDLSEATVHQQMALRLIARMKPRQAEVQQQQGGGGGGGGGPETRPDISELEMARNRNFYEQENMTREQQEAADEVLKKIKELAQRQQGVNEELAKLISEMQNASTEEEKERLKQKLERLQEEMRKNLESLDQAKQDLSSDQLSNEQVRTAQEALERARRQMNRSLEQMERDRLQQARTSGSRAMDALGEIQQHLQQFGRGAAAERIRELQETMDALRDRQQEIAEEAVQAREYHNSPSMEDQKALEATAEDLKEKKNQLAEDFVEMMDEASEIAERSKQTQQLMANKLGDWLRETSREGLLEDIEESQPFVEYGIWDTAVREEKSIARKFDSAAERLRKVAENLVDDDLEAMQQALERMDKLLGREEVAGGLGEQSEDGERGPGGEESEEGQAGMQEGGEPGEGQQGQESEEGQPGQVPGEGEGEEAQGQVARAQEDGEPGSAQGESGEQGQQGQQPGQQGQQSGESGQAQDGRGQAQDGSPGQNQQGGGGAFDSQRAMRNFADSGYRDWVEDLRDAETLLPEGAEVRTEVTRIRERVERIRREWRARALEPQYDLFLEMVARPLQDAAEMLQLEIEKTLNEKEFLLTDEGDIPERYKDHVSKYFKNLSASEEVSR